MVEARAHSDTGRPELALEVTANLQGLEADRLRADVLWKARRWRDAAEQIEKIYADRWNERTALADGERADVLRAAVGYALAEDTSAWIAGATSMRPRWPTVRTGAPSTS